MILQKELRCGVDEVDEVEERAKDASLPRLVLIR